MSDPNVLFELRGAVALVTLNRPQSLNSFTRAMHRELWAALDRIEADAGVRALVITGAGRGFCAGADLAEFDLEPGPDLVKRADPGPVIEQAFNPDSAQAAGAARADDRGGERRGGRRRRIAGDDLRPGGGGAGRRVHPGIQQDRAGAGRRRQLVPGEAARAGARPRLRDARRQAERAARRRSRE